MTKSTRPSRNMRILYHHRTAAGDGQRVHITEMVAAFMRRGHRVLVAGPRMVAGSFRKSNSIVPWIRNNLPAFVGELLELAYSYRAYQRLLKAIETEKPDILYERANLFLLGGLWAARKYKIPLVLEVNAPLTEERSKYGDLQLKSIASRYERKLWREADLVLTVSDVLSDIVIRESGRTKPTIAIPNGINPWQYPAQSKEANDAPTIGFIGFVRDWHRLDLIIDALTLPKFKKCKFEIVGSGPALEDLQQLTRDLNLTDRVTFPGLIERQKVPQHVLNWDIAVQPAVTPYASPLKMFEYMAAELAIIAPATKNICELLEHEKTGLLFHTEETEASNDMPYEKSPAAALTRLISDPALRQRLGKAARQKVLDMPYSWDGNVMRIEKLLEEHKILN